jgi:hypothetical protein
VPIVPPAIASVCACDTVRVTGTPLIAHGSDLDVETGFVAPIAARPAAISVVVMARLTTPKPQPAALIGSARVPLLLRPRTPTSMVVGVSDAWEPPAAVMSVETSVPFL